MYFFFSYSRQNNDSFLRDFFNDLNLAVRQMVGESGDAGFFDQKGLEPGEFWEKELEDALGRARVFIAAVTAGYAKSEYCGKEWAAFEARVRTYSEQQAKMPPLILPIRWALSIPPLPAAISERQYTYGDPSQDYNAKGLVRIYQLKQRYEEDRVNYIQALAEKIVALHDEHAALDKIGVPALADVASAFVTGDAGPGPDNAPKGPRRVHFVFGAGRPKEVANVGKKNIDPYSPEGGEDWQPYFPGTRRIGSIAMQIATADELDLWPDRIEITSSLSDDVRAAEARRELVVLFVDSWTAALPQYQKALQSFDRQNYLNCSVIVPWNELDPDTASHKDMLAGALQTALQFRASGQNELYYRGPIKTEEDLRKHLADVLTRLRAEIINKSAPAPGAVVAGGGRPLIAGPGK